MWSTAWNSRARFRGRIQVVLEAAVEFRVGLVPARSHEVVPPRGATSLPPSGCLAPLHARNSSSITRFCPLLRGRWQLSLPPDVRSRFGDFVWLKNTASPPRASPQKVIAAGASPG